MKMPEILEAMRDAAKALNAMISMEQNAFDMEPEYSSAEDYEADRAMHELRAAITALEGMQKDWQLVPKEPTIEMRKACQMHLLGTDAGYINSQAVVAGCGYYKAMLAAAPKPTGEE